MAKIKNPVAKNLADVEKILAATKKEMMNRIENNIKKAEHLPSVSCEQPKKIDGMWQFTIVPRLKDNKEQCADKAKNVALGFGLSTDKPFNLYTASENPYSVLVIVDKK